MLRTSLRALVALLAAQCVSSCLYQQNPELVAAREELSVLMEDHTQPEYAPDTYEHFVSHDNYPLTINIYKNPELMAQAPKKGRVVICLSQQRGRLYVGKEVAADWPVSTGSPGRATPTGNFSVLEKKAQYSSNRDGKLYNDKGKCINSDADAYKLAVPEGARFVGSPMPYWMRLTWDGVGMHIGKVQAGKPLSHGCIRTPRAMAEDLFRIVSIGTKVAVIQNLEADFPARDALAQGAAISSRDKRIRELQRKIYDLTQKDKPQQS